ncbi:hypothetical protein ES708_05812 [subsurface metagenome]
MILEKSGKRVKAHIRYKNKEGKIIPGVTTFIGILNKPALVPWANNLGLQGINVKDYVDDKKDIGTLAHEMIFSHLRKEKTDTSFYSQKQIDLAENSFLKYLEWEKKHNLKPILLEAQFVSEKYQYGGTVDNFCILDDVVTLLDYKTSKAIYTESHIQVSAYRNLLEEDRLEAISRLHPWKERLMQCAILRIGRDESEGFDFIRCSNMDKYFELFLHCVAIYNLKKQLKK